MNTAETPHILHITGAPAGGIRRHIHTALFGLREVKQSYACSFVDGDSIFKAELPRLLELLGGRVLEITVRKRPALSDISNLLRLRRFVRDNGVTIVHGHGAKGGAYARFLSRICGVKSVYTPHGGSLHAMFSLPEELVYRTVERSLAGHTDLFVFESRYSLQAYAAKVGHVPANNIVNYSGIEPARFDELDREVAGLGYPPSPRKVPEVGIFAALRPQKGQAVALKAVDILRRRGLNVKLNLFGAGLEKDELAAAAKSAGIARFISFHGEVSNAMAHMRAMDIVLIPSLFESFGYVALEALSLKRPVAAAAVGGLPEIITDGETGLLFEADSPEAVADAIQAYISDPAMALRLAENGFSRVGKDFSQAAMLANLERAYLTLSK